MNVTSFNFLKPQGDNPEIAERFAQLRQKLDQAKETFSEHQADAFVRTTAEDKSAVLSGVKTPQGSVTGVYREGKNGGEDLEVETTEVRQMGGMSGAVSRQIALHRDESNPKLLTMSETDMFGRQTTFRVNEETGDVSASQSKVAIDDGPTKLAPFNSLHPKTLNDAQGIAALAQVEQKIDDARTALQGHAHLGHQQSTASDRSLFMDGVKTDKGSFTGVLREGEGGVLDMEARFSDGSGGGWADVSKVGIHRDPVQNQVVLMDANSYYQTEFRIDESTGQVTPNKTRVAEEDFFPAQREFNYLHPKTLADAEGATELKSLQAQLQEFQAALTTPEAKDGVKTSGGWVTGRYDVQSGELNAELGTEIGTKQFNLSRFGETTVYTVRQETGRGTEYRVDNTTGEVEARRLRA